MDLLVRRNEDREQIRYSEQSVRNGSTTSIKEWVEEHHNKLVANSVIYLNTDIAVTGNYTFS